MPGSPGKHGSNGPRLAIIPNDPVDLYLKSGYGAGWLKAYFNPARFFTEVYSLAPYEQVDGALVGVIPRPTPAERLPQALQTLGIDVVRAYGGAHPCEIACSHKVPGIPVVVSVHDTTPELLHPSIVDADVVLCVSEAVRRLALSRVGHDRVWLLPNRVDFSVMRPRTPDETADLAVKYPYKYPILHVGRRSVQKNLDNLIRALAMLGSEYCLVAAGRGSLDEYSRLAADLGVRDRCFFVDAIANEELPRYFSWARCMCNPSRWEGMSIVLIEALASGAVLVASDIPEISESVHDGDNGVLIKDFENPGAIAAAIRTACTDETLRTQVRGRARKSVEQFERSRIDALEAGYYAKVLELQAAGTFRVPVGARIQKRLTDAARSMPGPIKDTLRPFIGRQPNGR